MINIMNDGQITPYTLILSKRNHKHLGQIVNVSGLDIMLYGGSTANEISFDVYKSVDGIEERLWDEIVNFKFVYVKELEQYFEIYVTVNEENQTIKSVNGVAACEAELSQTYLYDLEINTELDIAREDYVNPTIFYKPDRPQESLLHRVLSKVPHYSIKHVDDSLWKLQRTFSADGDDVLSFLTDIVAKEIKCLFRFDSKDRTISVYDLQTICLNCGERGDFKEECTKCGSKDIKFFGEDTTIYIDKENISKNLSYSTDTDSVKNCFRLEAGDDDMTAAISNINPNGSRYIYYFSDDTLKEMSEELRDKIASYDELVEKYKDEYEDIISNIYEYIDKVIYLTSSMMPTIENEETDAKKEAAKLTAAVLSPVGISRLNQNTSTATVNSAMKNYAKLFIHSGKYKIDVESGSFTYKGIIDNGTNYGIWKGNFKLTNYADEEDSASSPIVEVTINDSYETFLEQKISKKLKDEAKDEGSIYDVLSIKDLKKFKDAIKLYSLNRLISFKDAFQGAIDILIEDNQARESALFYDSLYIPYKDKLDACQSEMDLRSLQIQEYEKKLEDAEKRQKEIHKELDFNDYIGNELFKEFCTFRREDTYSNDNYISDGLENNEIIKRAKEFYEAAYKELRRSGEQQHSIQGDLISFLACEEFSPLMEHFDLNNFIRVGIDGKVYRLRLIFIELKFVEEGNVNIDIEFSDLMEIPNVVTDTEQILSQANSLAGNFGYVANQVEASKDTTNLVDRWVSKGLDLTNMKIVSSANNQNYLQDKNGLLIRSYDDIEGTYSPEQMKLVNSTLAITKDDWKTIDVAIGKALKKDPKTGEVKVFYGVQADQVVGRMILGEELGIYSSDAHMSMEFDNNGLVLNAIKGADNQYTKIIDIQVDGKSKFYIDRDGDLVIHNEFIDGVSEDIGGIKQQITDIEIDVSGFKSEVSETYSTKANTIFSNKEEFYLSTSPTELNGGSWLAAQPTWTQGKYIWRRTLVTYGDGRTTYLPSNKGVCISGNTGADGNPGGDGKGIKKITNYYLASSSGHGITTSTSGWTTTVQSITESKKYLWNYELITYTDNTTTNTLPCIIGTYGDKGATGVGIASITEYYQVSESNTVAPTKWVTTVPELTSRNKYLWNYEVITYTDNTFKETSKRVIGVYGDQGDDGKGIQSTNVTYQAGTSGTIIPTGKWSTSIPNVLPGQFLWTRTITTYTDNTTTTAYSVGKIGDKGENGQDGIGIKSTEITYQIGASQTSAPTGSWSTSVPKTTLELPYLWTRTIITYTDDTTSISYSVSSTLDSLEVGGKNLVTMSNIGAYSEGNIDVGSITNITVNGYKVDVSGNPNDLVGYVAYEIYSKFVSVSCYTNLKNIKCSWQFYTDNGLKIGDLQNSEKEVINGRYINIIPVPDGATVMYIGLGQYPYKNDYYIDKMMCVNGNKPMDWSPSPEDVKNETDKLINSSNTTIREEYKSLIDQTAKDIDLTVESLKTITDGNTSLIKDLSNQLQVTSEDTQFVKTTVTTLENTVNGKLSYEELKEWVRFEGANIEIGRSDSPFKMHLTNEKLSFTQSGVDIAWITNNQLKIRTAIIAESIGCGDFTFVDEGDNGFSLL